jgi:O-methyltransferase domain/Dimerisation domain
MTAPTSGTTSGASAAAPAAGPRPGDVVMQLALGFIGSAALYAATKLGIPDILKAGPKPVSEIARECGGNEEAVYRVLRALAPTGIFSETAPHTFALTAEGEVLLSDRPDSIRPMVLWIDSKIHFDTYPDLTYAMQTGNTVTEKVYGESCFGYFEKNPEVSRVFNEAMTGFSRMFAPAAIEAYDFSWLNGKTLADVGGGHGFVLTSILKNYPEIRGVLADLEHVVAGAPEMIRKAGVESRCTTQPTDFFAAVPAADAYVMKHIIHDWNDEKATTILRNCARAGIGKTRVILMESVVAPGNEPHFAKWLDLEMMLLPGGKERSEAEFAKLFEGAGFRLTRVLPTKGPLG